MRSCELQAQSALDLNHFSITCSFRIETGRHGGGVYINPLVFPAAASEWVAQRCFSTTTTANGSVSDQVARGGRADPVEREKEEAEKEEKKTGERRRRKSRERRRETDRETYRERKESEKPTAREVRKTPGERGLVVNFGGEQRLFCFFFNPE